VAGTRKSINASYHSMRERVQVSVRAVYDKLRKTETRVAQALVRRSAVKAAAIVKPLGLASTPLLPKLNVKILDGNHLAGTERRLEETRRRSAGDVDDRRVSVRRRLRSSRQSAGRTAAC
jgi:hypothetical protein